MACTFTLVKDTNALLSLFEPIQALADSEKDALGFLPKQALRDAVERGRLFALTADGESGQEIAGYLLYSGVFPHAKIQQIAVAAQYRKQAVGSSLIRSFVSDLEQLGFMSIKAEIASDLGGPLAFYRKNRFEFVYERDGGQTQNRKILVHVRQLETDNWQQTAHEVRRRAGFALPDNPPSGGNDSMNIATGTGNSIVVTPSELEDILSPAVIIWPRRESALVPIRRVYADDLLGTSNQQSFDFITNKDASFFSRRSFVNSPRTASVMRPECPIFFYESQTGNGRGAVVAVARIVDAIVVQKQDIPDERLRRLVVDDVEEFSATEEVLLTSFDNLFELPRPVPLNELRCLGAIDGANLVSPVSISSEQAATILTKGWPNE